MPPSMTFCPVPGFIIFMTTPAPIAPAPPLTYVNPSHVAGSFSNASGLPSFAAHLVQNIPRAPNGMFFIACLKFRPVRAPLARRATARRFGDGFRRTADFLRFVAFRFLGIALLPFCNTDRRIVRRVGFFFLVVFRVFFVRHARKLFTAIERFLGTLFFGFLRFLRWFRSSISFDIIL